MTFIMISLSIVALLFALSNAAEYPETNFEETIDVITSIGGEPTAFIYSFNITSGVDTGYNSTLNLTMLFIGDECGNPTMSLDYLMVDYNDDTEYLVITGAGLTAKCSEHDKPRDCYTFAPCISDYELPAIDAPLEFSIFKSGEVEAYCFDDNTISVRLWITISCDPKFAINDAAATDQFTSQTIDLFENDLFADSLEFVSLGSPETGFLINYGNGTIAYVPGPGAQERCENIAEDAFNVTFDYEVAIGNTSYYDIGAVLIEVSCVDIADIECVDTIKVVCVAVEAAPDFASDSGHYSYAFASDSNSRVYKKKKGKSESSEEIFEAVHVAEEANVFDGEPQTSANKEVISVRIAAAGNVWAQCGLMMAVCFVCVWAMIVLNKNIRNNNKV